MIRSARWCRWFHKVAWSIYVPGFYGSNLPPKGLFYCTICKSPRRMS